MLILALLHEQAPLKLRQIVEYTRVPYQAADRTLTSLHAQGHVMRTGDGTRGADGHAYGLTASRRLYCAALGVGLGI